METTSILDGIEYNANRPVVSVLLQSTAGKEMRIVFRKGQQLKQHKVGFPIVIHVVEGRIDLGAGPERCEFTVGSLIALEANVLHDLIAIQDSIVRLSISVNDTAGRVERLVHN
ncbi:MAG: cupin [Sphingobacterium sp.]|uniref:hypothetical protein n=1 Tax=Sphingobacterium sp. JB170 TaxID=1434842 RepID=UPI00097EAC9C|nr:hypothetical protein [Sphingobacterium sp. JB170]SJN45139.1 hypothetical protein FM107_13400 [Sphingobacterium sp. JB170]